MAEGKDFVCFGPQENDTVPDIRYRDPKEGEKDDKEVLIATVTGTIKNFDRLEKFNVTIKISDKALTAAGYEWTETGEGSSKSRTYTYSAEKAYIALPGYAVDTDGRFLPLPSDTSKTTAPKTISAEDSMFTAGANANEKNFTFDVTFGWGEKFKGYNPGRYLDREETDKPDKTYTEDEKLQIMTELRSRFTKDGAEEVDAENLKFVVTVEAVSK